MANNPAVREGGCLCGQVRYTAPKQPAATLICHCRNCQKQAGSAFSVVTVFSRNDVQVTGKLSVYEDRGTSGQKVWRQFCGQCGSPVITDTEQARQQDIIFIKAGTFDEVNDLEPTVHYWVQSAQHWLLPLPSDVEQLQTQ